MSLEPAPLPSDVFLQTFNLVPRVAVCLLVRDHEGSVLLARRAERMSMAGVWHLPGAFLWRGETIATCAERIARKELGASIVSFRQFGVYEDLDADPRGHVIDIVLKVALDGPPRETEETGEVRFFRKVPPEIAFYHDRVLEAAGLSR